jgi:hypothetical protein
LYHTGNAGQVKELGAKERKVKSPTLAKNRTARVGHPKAFFGIKARPAAMNRLTQGVSMGDMVALADRYYDDPKHAADPPTTALITSLFQSHAK